MTLFVALSPGIAIVLLLLIYLLYLRLRRRGIFKEVEHNLSIGGQKPIFSDIRNDRYYGIKCKCGNEFSVRTTAIMVECEKCGSKSKLSDLTYRLFDGLRK
jgi:hypothetical protein